MQLYHASEDRVARAKAAAQAIESRAAPRMTWRAPNAPAAGPVRSRPTPPAARAAVRKASIAFARMEAGTASVTSVKVGAFTTGLARPDSSMPAARHGGGRGAATIRS